jgi:hypothetical protein
MQTIFLRTLCFAPLSVSKLTTRWSTLVFTKLFLHSKYIVQICLANFLLGAATACFAGIFLQGFSLQWKKKWVPCKSTTTPGYFVFLRGIRVAREMPCKGYFAKICTPVF